MLGFVVIKSYMINKNGFIIEGNVFDFFKYEVEEFLEKNECILMVYFKMGDFVLYLIEFKILFKGKVID